MRDALGPDIDIMIDVNMGWTADQAIHAAQRIQEHDIYWLEEPVLADDYAGYQRCAQALHMRVVGGETHFGRADLLPLLEGGASRSCSRTRCAAASPNCARSRRWPTRMA